MAAEIITSLSFHQVHMQYLRILDLANRTEDSRRFQRCFSHPPLQEIAIIKETQTFTPLKFKAANCDVQGLTLIGSLGSYIYS